MNRETLISILSALVVWSLVGQGLGDVHVGNLKGQLSVEQGQAVYRLPIELPKGPNNIQPNLNLVYNSGGGNGPLGMGWGLDLMSAISRCPQTLAQDGKIRGIKYDSEDRFCLDGQRLVVVHGLYGTDRSEYRTEIDTFSKVVAHGQKGSGPETFRVWAKDGRVLDYSGQSIDDSGPVMHQWNLVQVSDRAGNILNITYMGRSNFPKSLHYGTTTVEAKYEARPDTSTQFYNGKVLRNITERLVSIDILNPQPLRKYTFEYRESNSGGSNQSILETVLLCDHHETCLKPLLFNYDESDQLVETFPTAERKLDEFGTGWTLLEHPRYIRDMNGDGYADIVGFHSSCVKVALNTGHDAKFNTSRCWVAGFGYSTGWRGANHPRYVVDVNGDGFPDVIGFMHDGVHLSINNGHFLESESLVLSEFGYTAGAWRTSNHLRLVTDVNGDGRADIVGFHNNGVQVALSKGRTFEPSTTWSNEFGYTVGAWRIANHPRFLKDINGDGLPDIVGMASDGVYVALNTGTSFEPSSKWLTYFHYDGGWRTQHHPRYVEDINNDGLADIIGFFPDGVHVSISTGSSFTDQTKVVSDFGYTAGAYRVVNHPRLVADVTGDGLPEILGFHNDGLHVSINRGQGEFSESTRWANEFGYSAGGWRVASDPRELIDVNGDSIADIIGFASSGPYVSLNQNKQPRVHHIQDSFQVKQEIVYTTLPEAMKTGHYDKSDSATYPIQSSCLPMSVVTKVNNHLGTMASNTTEYSYGDLKIDLQGRGGLGFRRTKESFHNHKSITTEMHQDFPLIGKTEQIKHVIEHGQGETIVSEALMTYSIHRKDSVYQVLPSTEEIVSREIDDTLISKVTNQYIGSNNYGDPLVIISQTVGGGNIFTQTTNNTYRSIPHKWQVGQLMLSRVSHSSACSDTITRHTAFEYNANTGFLITQTTEPDNELSLATEFEYDRYGNVISRKEIPVLDRGKFREVSKTYDDNGIYVKTSSNSKGHTEGYIYDSQTGTLTSLIGANGLITNWTYDTLGRKTGEYRADGTVITWSYNWDTSDLGFVYNIRMASEGSPTKTRIYDALDRVVREASMGFNLENVYEDITYNKEGLIHRHSFPYFVSENAVYTEFSYDILGRTTTKKTPGPGGTTSQHHTRYNGLMSQTVNPLGHITRLEKDVLGRLIEVTDHLGGVVQYAYDSVGNMVETTDAGGSTIKTEYDVLGHKTAVDDPNMGRWKYRHNAFGELVWQKDANSNILEQEYDVLGRIVKRSEREGETTWVYDTSPHGLGKPANVQQADGYKQHWSYNEFGRETLLSTTVQEEAFVIQTSYDDFGRIEKQTFPDNISVFREYSEQGYLQKLEIGDANDNKDIKEVWRAIDYDSSGRVKAEQYGNGLITDFEYDPATHLVGLRTYRNGGDMLRQLRFIYDNNDNLISREDLQQHVSETFAYDALDRLVQSTVESTDGSYQWRQNWDYYNNGNIRFNDYYGLGPFIYHPTKPHAVAEVGSHTYTYDLNGNALSKDGNVIQWTSYNKPKQFETSSGAMTLKYAPDRSRYFKRSSNGDTTVYLGKTYEMVTAKNTSSSKVFVYGAMGRIVAIVNKNMTNDNRDVSYAHTDNLGSVDTVTDERADILERLNYGAFGRRRSGNWRESTRLRSQNIVRGYTGHEHLEEMGLIHMNGRVYDPAIGRFLSPDPHVQDLTLTQALNRYTYALNNPLRHNDPSGFFFKKIKRFVKKYWKPIVGVAVSVVTFGAATPFAAAAVGALGVTGTTAAVATGALAGAVGGFAGGTFVTGDVRGGLKSATGGAVFGGIGGYFGSSWNVERVATQATAGGVVSELAGGKFKDGFVVVGLAASARYLYNTIVQYDVDASPGGPAKLKSANQLPYEGRNNIGIQGKPPDASWVDKDQFLGMNWGEGGGVSRLLNRVPGINAVAGLHDVFQVELDNVFFPGARDIFNVPGMLPAAAISYAALLDGPGIPALLVDEGRKK